MEERQDRRGSSCSKAVVGRLCQTPWRFTETPYNLSLREDRSEFLNGAEMMVVVLGDEEAEIDHGHGLS